MSMVDRIIRLAGEKEVKLPLAVTFSAADREIPAHVTKLLKEFFVVEVDPYISEGGRTVSIGAVRLTYRGEPYGRAKIPKKHQSTRPRDFHPGVYGKDLEKVRVLSGRSAY